MAFRSLSKALLSKQFPGVFKPSCIRTFSEEQKPEEKKAEEKKPEEKKPEEKKATESPEALKTKDFEAKVKTLETEALHYKDLYIRAVAEQENIRKRLMKEIDNESNYAITKFAKEMLEVGDNLNRALENTKPEDAKNDPQKSLKDLLEGVSMTRDILKGVYGKFHITEYCPVGDKFDPNQHEALFAYEDKSKEPGSVGQVFVNGFKIKDRILRVAKVGVVKK